MLNNKTFLVKNTEKYLLLGDVINYLTALENQLNLTKLLLNKTMMLDSLSLWIYFSKKVFKREKTVDKDGGVENGMDVKSSKVLSIRKNHAEEIESKRIQFKKIKNLKRKRLLLKIKLPRKLKKSRKRTMSNNRSPNKRVFMLLNSLY